jgi:predicted DCC family thiol-disulfide oxidoreductase YuxK
VRDDPDPEGVWFIYDGDCPVCAMSAEIVKLRRNFRLHLINARDEAAHDFVKRIDVAGFDLNQGMAIIYQSQIYIGDEALALIAALSDDRHGWGWIVHHIFKSRTRSRVLYPFLRAFRNGFLNLKGVRPIDMKVSPRDR